VSRPCIYPPFTVKARVARQKIHLTTNAVAHDQITKSRASAPGLTLATGKTKDAGPDSRTGNGVNAAIR
jgi:hypothetical protein